MDLIKEAHIFLDILFEDIDKTHLNLDKNFLDHICYRASTQKSYEKLKLEFSKLGNLLIESLVGGRLISTYKLFDPILYQGREINIVEVPAPKKGKIVQDGYEHAEFVIKKSFEEMTKLYPELDFDFKGTNKEFNPELMVSLDRVNIKFHHLCLEEVISIELATS